MTDNRMIAAALGGAAVLLLIFFCAGLLTVYTGAYNVAATEDHTAIGRWALDTTMKNSVKSRAADVAIPANADISAGASEFKAMCQHCHGAPGARPAEWAAGMLPNPPRLAHAAEHWSSAELFWIVKHGIKMSGMPAFGPTHSDEDIWNIVAFVDQLPAMTAAQYAAFPKDHKHGGPR